MFYGNGSELRERSACVINDHDSMDLGSASNILMLYVRSKQNFMQTVEVTRYIIVASVKYLKAVFGVSW